MSFDPWLPLTDYSTKYKVSVSTLRRKIKTEDIKFRFQDGKYFIIDEPMGAHQKHRPSPNSDQGSMGAHLDSSLDFKVPNLTFEPDENPKVDLALAEKMSRVAKKDEPILTAANKLLVELKRAYTQVLQEKEEQMMSLKEEIADLKTLVKVLESENQRLKDKRTSR